MTEEFVCGDMPDGWTAKWITVPYQTESGFVVHEPFLVASPTKTPEPKKPRAAMVPGTATVTLGSEKKNEPADVHD